MWKGSSRFCSDCGAGGNCCNPRTAPCRSTPGAAAKRPAPPAEKELRRARPRPPSPRIDDDLAPPATTSFNTARLGADETQQRHGGPAGGAAEACGDRSLERPVILLGPLFASPPGPRSCWQTAVWEWRVHRQRWPVADPTP